jgi:hypothetical protein
MEINYKFEVGDTVTHAAAASWRAEDQAKKEDGDQEKGLRLWGDSYSPEQRWFIVERHLQECPGGVQKHYTCRGVSRGGSVTKDYFRFNEIELAAFKK